MEKIVFEDLPSQNTPIDADNLNKMQDNIENEINNVNQIQYRSFYATEGTEYSITFNVKPTAMNWNYDLYKISMYLGEANWYTIKDVYVGIGLHDWGDYQAKIVKQSLIWDEDFIENITIQNNGDNTATLKFTTTKSAKMKIKIEPYAVYL